MKFGDVGSNSTGTIISLKITGIHCWLAWSLGTKFIANYLKPIKIILIYFHVVLKYIVS